MMSLDDHQPFAREEYAVGEDIVVEYRNPGMAVAVADPLTEVLRSGAQRLLCEAIEAEVAQFIDQHLDLKDERGRQRVVRNGHLPERNIQTGIGSVEVSAPRVRDRAGEIKFTSAILPRYLRRSRSVEQLLPWLYLKGISTGDFNQALTAILGRAGSGSVGPNDWPAQRNLERGAREMGQAGLDGQTLCVLVG